MKIIFNGKNIDNEIPGYTTLNIEGRDFIIQNIETVSPSGMDGAFLLGRVYPPRKITVEFLIKSVNSFEKRTFLEKLNMFLNTDKEVEFSFTDDEECFYFGKVIEIKSPPVNSHNGVGAFSILCLDPYKYGILKTTNRQIVSKSNLDVKIESITATTNSTSKIILSNTTKGSKIILNDSFVSGGKLEINHKIIKVNGADKKDKLDFVESDYMEFKLYNGDVVTISGGSNLLIKYRERWI